MVALKQGAPGPMKNRIAWKQERRGGIETRGMPLFALQRLMEAGTPWWH